MEFSKRDKFRLISIFLAGILTGIFGTLAFCNLLDNKIVYFFYFLILAFLPAKVSIICILTLIGERKKKSIGA